MVQSRKTHVWGRGVPSTVLCARVSESKQNRKFHNHGVEKGPRSQIALGWFWVDNSVVDLPSFFFGVSDISIHGITPDVKGRDFYTWHGWRSVFRRIYVARCPLGQRFLRKLCCYKTILRLPENIQIGFAQFNSGLNFRLPTKTKSWVITSGNCNSPKFNDNDLPEHCSQSVCRQTLTTFHHSSRPKKINKIWPPSVDLPIPTPQIINV